MISGPHQFCCCEDTSDTIRILPLWRGHMCFKKARTPCQAVICYKDCKGRFVATRMNLQQTHACFLILNCPFAIKNSTFNKLSSQSVFTAFFIYFPTVLDATLLSCEKVCPSRRPVCPSVCVSIFLLAKKKKEQKAKTNIIAEYWCPDLNITTVHRFITRCMCARQGFL